jgi:hypothetical protein
MHRYWSFHADVSDGGVLGDVIVPDVLWNHETGVCSGSTYEAALYPGIPEPRVSPYSNVRIERVKVILVGEELGNLHLLLEAQSPE